jgi:ribose 5-phosphate isomerase A
LSADDVITKIGKVAIENVTNGNIIGLGSGSTVEKFVKVLGAYVKEKAIQVYGIPSSLQIQLIAENEGLKIIQPNLIPLIDLTVDGADQIDKKYNMIKGGGGALLREKVLIRAAKKTVILATDNKFTDLLGRGQTIPIEVLPFARSSVFKEIEKLDGKPKLRVSKKDYPCITENGNIIYDIDFGLINNPQKLLHSIKKIPGVIEVGIFIEKIFRIYKGNNDGTINVISP